MVSSAPKLWITQVEAKSLLGRLAASDRHTQSIARKATAFALYSAAPMTLGKVGNVFGVSTERARQMVYHGARYWAHPSRAKTCGALHTLGRAWVESHV